MTRSGNSRTPRARLIVRPVWRAAALGVYASVLMGLSAAAAAPHTPGGTQTVLSSHKSKLGWQLVVEVNGQKLSLYFDNSSRKTSCYGRCAKVWPPLLDRGRIVVANRSCHRSGCHINRRWLGTVRRKRGSLQLTYHGYPVYRYSKDTKTGQAKGLAREQFGLGPWAAVLTNGARSCGLGCGY